MKEKIIEVFCVGLFSSLLVIILQLYFPEHQYLSSITGASLGGLLGFGIAVSVIKAQNRIRNYKEPKFSLDDDKLERLILLTFILALPSSIIVLREEINIFPNLRETEMHVKILFYCFIVILFSMGIPSVVTFLSFDIDTNHPLVKYGLILSSVAIPFTGLLFFLLPIIINLTISVLSFLYILLPVKRSES